MLKAAHQMLMFRFFVLIICYTAFCGCLSSTDSSAELADSFERQEFELSGGDNSEIVLQPRRNCSSSCLIHKDLQQLRLEKIKEHILQELNLERPPNVTGIKPPKALVDNILSKCMLNDSPKDVDVSYPRESIRVPKLATKALVSKKYTFAEKVTLYWHCLMLEKKQMRKEALRSIMLSAFGYPAGVQPNISRMDIPDGLKATLLDKQQRSSEYSVVERVVDPLDLGSSTYLKTNEIPQGDGPGSGPGFSTRSSDPDVFLRHTKSLGEPRILSHIKFLATESEISAKKLPLDPRRSFFNFDTMRNYPVLNATLYAYLNVPKKASTDEVHTVHLHLYKYVSGTEIDATPLQVRTIKEDLRPNGKWEMFNITSTVYDWMKSKDKNFGVMLKGEFEEEDVINRDYDKTKKTMFIEVQVREEYPRTVPERLARMRDCEEGSFYEECCRYPLMVDFESFGWDWIIAPKRYNAYYCAGKCNPSLSRYLVGHLREQQQLLQEIMGKNLGSIGPCCSPHAMRDMKVIYYNEYKQIIERTIPDMIVDRCSCG